MSVKPMVWGTLLVLLLGSGPLRGQGPAWERAARLGKGMNLSWMEQYWEGSPDLRYADYLNWAKLDGLAEDLELMQRLGVQTLRLPVSFEYWAEEGAPHQLLRTDYFTAIDSLLLWCERYDFNLVLDYQHGWLEDCSFGPSQQRLLALWQQIAMRYRDSDPERLFFELYNEPHTISAERWQTVVEWLVAELRPLVPKHTFIIGGVDYNSIRGLLQLQALSDPNIIYTFHFYEPFLFTHQGANWAGRAVATTRIPFPYDRETMPPLSPRARGSTGEKLYRWYRDDGQEHRIREYLQVAKHWSLEQQRPIWCGEWGSHDRADRESRCRYAAALLQAFQELDMPHCYWEWDRNFSFFEWEVGWEYIPDCMMEAWESTIPQTHPSMMAETDPLVIGNPFGEQLVVHFPQADRFERCIVYHSDGRLVGIYYLGGSSWTLDTQHWGVGTYLLRFENLTNAERTLLKVFKTVGGGE
ncbi:MAG: cellulase family glycosylhydrolase [Bacteroidota bacterium]